MVLSISYSDKYRLWADVFRGGNDQFFVPTTESLLLGTSVTIEIHLPDLSLPLLVNGTVTGLRPPGLRFATGVYVRLPGPEVDRCRRLLGMAPPREPVVGRRARRLACDLAARIVDPKIGGALRVRNLSLTGALMTGRMTIPRVPLKLEMTLSTGETLTVGASNSWLGFGAFTAGVRFDGLGESETKQLRDEMARLERAGATGPVPRRVIIADDDPSILHMLDTVLSKHGYETYRAADGAEAVDLIRDLSAGLVLLDLLMPGVDGADICRMMRADVELAHVPVIFLSALDETTLISICEETGASDYLTKPVALADVLNMVGRYLAMTPDRV